MTKFDDTPTYIYGPNIIPYFAQGLLNVLAAPNTTDEGKMFMEGLQVSNNTTIECFSGQEQNKKYNMIKPFNHNIMIFRKEGAIRIIIQPSTKMRRLVEKRTRRRRSRMVRRRRMKMNLENTRTSR